VSKRILVIDDEKSIRKLFQLTLEATDYHVDTAESGEKGIEMARQAKYDLFYLDLKMPGMNGVETLQELRSFNRDTPVYIITAFHEEFFDQLKQVHEDGIEFEILRKPLDSEQLIAITQTILGDQPFN
jgi:CheY-like chemotaxis protein